MSCLKTSTKTPTIITMKSLCAVALLLALISSTAYAAPRTVVATFLPIAIFADNVSGGLMKVELLVPPAVEVHEFSLRPQDLRRLEAAELVLANGAGLDAALLGPYSRKDRVVDTSRGVALRPLDPHIWLDPINAGVQVRNIASAMSANDPANAATYAANADRYAQRLLALDAEIRAALWGAPRTLVTYHDFMGYFGARYGLKTFSLTGAGGEQPLPRNIAALEGMVKAQGVRAVFMEEGYPASALAALARELGVKVCLLASLESGKFEPGYYEAAMRRNLKSMTECAR